jgi:hypothetical protein
MCCDAKVIPAVLGTHGEILSTWVAPPATPPPPSAERSPCETAAAPAQGCTPGPKWGVPHHITAWADSGSTDLDNLGLCEREHLLLHHGVWEMRLRDRVIYWTPPAWIDPDRTHIPNTAHDPPQQ